MIGKSAMLSWETSNAVDVLINPNIGNVQPSGTKTVTPPQTTTYTLIAKNEEGKTVESEVKIQVVPLPFNQDIGAKGYNNDQFTDIAFHRPGGPWKTVPVLFARGNGTWNSSNSSAPGWANQPDIIAISSEE